MEKLTYKATGKEKSLLESLEYWLVETFWLRDHGYAEDGADMKKARENVNYCFDQIDKYNFRNQEKEIERRIPYWAQNKIIAWCEERRYNREYFSSFLASMES